MPPPPYEAYIQIIDEAEAAAFCLRRMETITDSDCQTCFEAHEQLQAGYRSRHRCAELHWVAIAEFLPSSRETRDLGTVPFPSISHPPQKRHRRWA
jgi:hypothetical protein